MRITVYQQTNRMTPHRSPRTFHQDQPLKHREGQRCINNSLIYAPALNLRHTYPVAVCPARVLCSFHRGLTCTFPEMQLHVTVTQTAMAVTGPLGRLAFPASSILLLLYTLPAHATSMDQGGMKLIEEVRRCKDCQMAANVVRHLNWPVLLIATKTF